MTHTQTHTHTQVSSMLCEEKQDVREPLTPVEVALLCARLHACREVGGELCGRGRLASTVSAPSLEDVRAFTVTANEQSCGSCPCDLGAITKVTNTEFSSVTVKAICCFHRSP